MQSTQVQHLQQWVDDVTDNNVGSINREKQVVDDYIHWMDKIGRVGIYLAVITGTITLIAQIGMWRGWW